MFCTVCATHNPVAAGRCAGCGRDLVANGGASRTDLGGGRRSAAAGRDPRLLLRRVLVLVPLLAAVVAAGGYYRAESAAPKARYAEAEAAETAGRYEEAIDAYAAAGDHRDAAARRASLAADLAAARSAAQTATAALDAGRPDEAIALLVPVVRALPRDADAAALLALAHERRLADLRLEAETAEADGDWLRAERALAALLAADPVDEAVADRLAAVRRAHAPLVFARDRALYLVGPDGEDERLLTDAVTVAHPVWSPDRSRIAFVSVAELSPFANATLYVVNVDGTGLTAVHDRVHPDAVPAWSPDGTRIAYTSAAAIDLRSSEGLLTVRVVDVASGVETDLTSRTGRHATSPTWSPTGDRLAFTSRPIVDNRRASSFSGKGEVYVADLASGAVTDLSANRLPSVSRAWWSPTGDRLLVYTFVRRGTGGGSPNRSPVSGIYLLEAKTRAIDTVVEASETVHPPVWAPDGSRFAFVDGETALHVHAVDGGQPPLRVDLARPVADIPTWSPDGDALVVPASPSVDSVVVPLDGTALAPLPLTYDSAPPTYGPPQWSAANPLAPPASPAIAGTALDPGRAPLQTGTMPAAAPPLIGPPPTPVPPRRQQAR